MLRPVSQEVPQERLGSIDARLLTMVELNVAQVVRPEDEGFQPIRWKFQLVPATHVAAFTSTAY